MKAVVLDIGGTTIQAGIFQDGRVTDKKEEPANACLGGYALMEKTKKIIASYSGYDCIGISTAGQVDSDRGVILNSKNIPGYSGLKLREVLENEFMVPVIVENDVNAAALGEAIYGNGQNSKDKDFLCLTYGTGIGGAIVRDGKLIKGISYSAGEFGFIITHAEKKEEGYYENYASTVALVNKVKEIMPELDNGKKIIAHIKQHAVKEIVDNWIDEVIYGLISLIHCFNPSLVILGGGIMKQVYVLESIREKIKKHIMPNFESVIIVSAALGNEASLWGVGYLTKTFYSENIAPTGQTPAHFPQKLHLLASNV